MYNRANCSLQQLRNCQDDLVHAMNESTLKLNADKSEFLIIGTQTQYDQLAMVIINPYLDSILCLQFKLGF